MSAITQSTELATAPPVNVQQINALHAEVLESCARCSDELYHGVAAAREAGQLLNEAKQYVHKNMGHGAWSLWLEKNFTGSERTAQRYMFLAKTVTHVSVLRGLSIRQAYLILGMATEPKQSTTSSDRLQSLPPHIAVINRFQRWINKHGDIESMTPVQRDQLKKDFKPLFVWLCKLYKTGGN